MTESGAAAQRALGNAVARLGGAARVLYPSDAELAELRLREPEVAVQVIELLLETREAIKVLVWGVGSHVSGPYA